MNTPTLLGALLCLVATSLWGQSKQHAQFSYISDRTFTSPDQLMGYDFKPAMREVPGEEPTEFSVGKYSFGITRRNLYVEGPDIQGVYSVNNINTTEYGFILQTMNARDPTIQGHLKVVVDELGQVEGLIFKRSTHDKEVIFFLRTIPADVDAAEALYFTNKGEKRISHIDSLWTGVEVRPFLRVFQNMGGIQQRIIMSDSVYLKFYKVVTIEEKEKRGLALPGFVSKKRGLFGKKKEEETLLPAATYTEAKVDTAAAAATRTALLASLGVATDSLRLAPLVPVDQEVLLGNPFDSTAVDSIPPLTSHLPPLTPHHPPIDTSTDVKVKITTEFFVDLTSFMRFDDGSEKMQDKTFLVNGIVERENPNARPGGNRWQWELNLHKQPNAYIYLDERYQVNSIQIDGQKFYMRGH